MSQKTLFMVFLLIAAFILANILAGRRMKKAADFIIRDLKEKTNATGLTKKREPGTEQKVYRNRRI